MTEVPVLELHGFGVAYGPRQVLLDVTLSVPAEGCTVLLGPSGTGKSTLLRTLAGYNRANPDLRTWGRARYAGNECSAVNAPALVMQNSRLLVSNVLENLVCELPGRSTLTQRMQIETIAPLLAQCGESRLLDCLFTKVVERPLAEQRVVAIVRQAIAAPELLMIDEPTAGLTRQEADRVLHVVESLRERCAILLVLHNLMEARRVADRIVLLAGGRVQEASAAAAFFEAPRSESGRRFLATGSCPEPTREQDAPASGPEASEAVPLVPAQPVELAGASISLPKAGVRAPVHAASAACGPRGFMWLLPGQLAGTPWPGVVHNAAYDLQALRGVGITRLISLTEEPYDAVLAGAYGIDCASYPMPDMHPPTMQQALAICAHIDRLLDAGEVVAVHCRAGLGRTGTVLAAYWIWLGRGDVNAVRALEDVRRLEPGWVQSEAQVKFLEEFALVVAETAAGGRASYDPEAAPDVALPNL